MEHKGLLSGMKVLDLSRVLAAPYCGMMLADLGAEVIKIERPGKGDDARSNFPIVNGESAYYMNLNRNKRGIVLNLKSQAGKVELTGTALNDMLKADDAKYAELCTGITLN